MLTTLVLLTATHAHAGAKVSSFMKETKRGANYFNGASAIDGKPETAWMVPGESPNRGEWIEVDIPKGDVDKIGLMPGWNKDEESFTDYPRVKTIRVDVYDLDDDQNVKQVGSATLQVADKREWQIIDMPDVKVGANGLFGGKVRISIVDIYDGEDFPNLGVSEMMVYLKEYDSVGKVTGGAPNVDGHGVDLAGDTNPKTFWAGPAGSTFEADGNGFGLGSIGFVGAGKDWGRAKTVEVTANGITLTTVLADKPDVQWAAVPGFNGYTGGGFGGVSFKIVDSYAGKNADVGVSEIKLHATCHEDL